MFSNKGKAGHARAKATRFRHLTNKVKNPHPETIQARVRRIREGRKP